MRRPLPIAILLAATVVATACSDNSSSPLPTQPIRPNLVAPSNSQLVAQINALYPLTSPQGNLRGPALAAFAPIRTGVARSTSSSIATAQQLALQLVASTVTDYQLGALIGGQSLDTRTRTTQFITSLLQFVQLSAPAIDPSVLGTDGAIQLCQPSGTNTCNVVNPSNTAGVSIPPGALSADVLVTIQRLNDAFTPPDPEQRTQYPLVFDVSTTPAVTLPENNEAIVAICQYNEGALSPPPDVRSRLVIGHFLADGTVELLPRADASVVGLCGESSEQSPSGLGFNGSRTDTISWSALRYASDELGRLLAPAPLFATHTALAGKTKSFSPFKAVDPGGPAVSSVSVSPDPAEVYQRSTLQLTATPRAADETDL
ncbi:MAG TPA: hypothetical protein VFJ96_08740, partial [Gemmatimonadaceae bacterium]|nr:hypothetical protein [Gemmatimonadaceae bacterium]